MEQDNRALYEEALGLIGDGTLSHLRRLLKDHDGYVGHMNHWTGRYGRSDTYQVHDVGWLLGRLWVLFAHTQDQEFHDLALRIIAPMVPDLTEKPIMGLPSGCEIFFGLCLGADMTGSDELRGHAIAASRNLVANLWCEELGRFRPWPNFPDDEVALEWGGMLYHLVWTSGEVPEHLDYFARHHESVLAAGLVRPDGSTAHVAYLDEHGNVARHETLQGYDADSTWARGQSWAMHNFGVAAEVTGRPALREASQRMNRWWLDNIPEDWVPYYDFADPDRELRPRDADAAAMAASILMRPGVGEGLPDTLPEVLDATLAELCNNYVSAGGVLLHGSLGQVAPVFYFGGRPSRKPPGHGEPGAVLARFPQEEIMPYGNYFLAEVLHRRLRGQPGFPSFVGTGPNAG